MKIADRKGVPTIVIQAAGVGDIPQHPHVTGNVPFNPLKSPSLEQENNEEPSWTNCRLPPGFPDSDRPGGL